MVSRSSSWACCVAPMPRARYFDASAQAGHVAFEDAGSGQQDFVRHQPGCRPFEQHAWPVGTGPAQGIKPARQAPSHLRLGDLDVAVVGADLGGVQPALSAHPIGVHAVEKGIDVERLGERLHSTAVGTSSGSSRKVPR